MKDESFEESRRRQRQDAIEVLAYLVKTSAIIVGGTFFVVFGYRIATAIFK